MLAAIAELNLEARSSGFLVSPLIIDAVEMIVPTQDDPVFGLIVTVGLGGVFVEVTRDVVFRGPIGVEKAHAMLDEMRGRKILAALRGRPAADVDALAEAISRLSVFGSANSGRFSTIEINPLLVRPPGQGCLMADALVTFPTENGT
jgi:hypothetical protein